MKKWSCLIIIFFFMSGTASFAESQKSYVYGVRVGIIDSGVNKINDYIIEGYNFLDNNTNTTDNKGHGTAIAGIVSEIVPNALIIPLKCTEKSKTTDNAGIITAIYQAIDKYDCDVINISIGMPNSEKLRAAVEYAVKNGAIVVSAVGNDGELSYKKDKIYYPAGYENVIGVGSVDEKNVISKFSQQNTSVFVTAPGERGSNIGTSFSAAWITGAAALAKSFNRQMLASQFKEYLKNSSQDLGTVGYDRSYGNGLIKLDLLQKNLKIDYPVFITHLDKENFTICNSKKTPITGTLFYIDKSNKTSTKNIEIPPGKEITCALINSQKCYLWQNNIFDIVWILKGGR